MISEEIFCLEMLDFSHLSFEVDFRGYAESVTLSQEILVFKIRKSGMIFTSQQGGYVLKKIRFTEEQVIGFIK
jgi:hypothetical protein